MRIQTTVLMSHGDESHPTELVDISATGVLLRRPLGWNGEPGQSWVLDMIFGGHDHSYVSFLNKETDVYIQKSGTDFEVFTNLTCLFDVEK